LVKLYEISEIKINEIKKLREKQSIEKESFDSIIGVYEKQNGELRNRLGEIELSHKA
jgi:hypothetical protein